MSGRWSRALLGLGVVLAAGCASAPRTEPPAVARFFVEAEEPGAVELMLPQSGVRVAVSPKPVLTEFDLAAVDVAQEEFGRCLQFRFTGWAARDLYRLSVARAGRRLVLVVDGEPRGARRMEGPIADGVVRVFVEVPDDTLPALAAQVQRTAMAAREKN